MLLDNPINKFSGEYAFLSNFYPAPTKVPWSDILYPTAEHAYQAAKTSDPRERQMIADCRWPGQAKLMGRTLTIRKDWELVKVEVMKCVVLMKFLQNGDLGDRLMLTYDRYLEEGNDHGDMFWGTVNGKGLNVLGNILMEVRKAFVEDFGASTFDLKQLTERV